jgi:hypothetical protein
MGCKTIQPVETCSKETLLILIVKPVLISVKKSCLFQASAQMKEFILAIFFFLFSILLHGQKSCSQIPFRAINIISNLLLKIIQHPALPNTWMKAGR